MTAAATTDLPAYPFASPTDSPFLPVSEADQACLDRPIRKVQLPTGTWAWLVTRHQDVRQLLRHPKVSSDLSLPNFPLFRPIPEQRPEDRKGSFIRMDGEEHSRLRRMLTAEFMIKNVRRIEPLIEQTVVDTLEKMRAAGPPADLVSSFALPVPSMVICHLLGVPYADHDFFQQRSRTLLDFEADPQLVRTAVDELRDYLRVLIAAKRAANADGEGLLDRLIRDRVIPGELDEDELVGIGLLLLIAGHETTANMIGLSVLLLLQHPELLASVRANPGIAPDLVEELLRYLTIVRTGLPRLATEDIEIGGQLIRAGEGIIAMLPLANRDDEIFANGDEFHLRPEAHQHLAFGFGVHQCIGQPLARAELRVALVELARRFPGLRATVTPADVPKRPSAVVYGLAELPVTW